MLGFASLCDLSLCDLPQEPVVVDEGRAHYVPDHRQTPGWLWEKSRRGIDLLREQLAKEQAARKIPDAASAVIAKVAEKQASRTTNIGDEIRNTQQLVRALERQHIKWQRSYDEALAAYREHFRTQQIAALLEMNGIYADVERQQARHAARLRQEFDDAAIALLLLH